MGTFLARDSVMRPRLLNMCICVALSFHVGDWLDERDARRRVVQPHVLRLERRVELVRDAARCTGLRTISEHLTRFAISATGRFHAHGSQVFICSSPWLPHQRTGATRTNPHTRVSAQSMESRHAESS